MFVLSVLHGANCISCSGTFFESYIWRYTRQGLPFSPLFPIFRHRSSCTVRKIYLSGVIFCLYFAVDIYMLPLETVDSQVDLA